MSRTREPEAGGSPWPDLAALTGVRSGKGSFYPEYRGVAERLERVVHALETISRALVRTVEGPDTLVRAVVEAAAEHLSAEWVVFALSDGALPEARPRQLVLGPDGYPHPTDLPLPAPVLAHLGATREGGLAHHDDGPAHHTHVPIVLDGGVVGAFVAWTPAERTIDATDTAVLTILAGQTAVALQNSALFTSGKVLLERSEHAYAESTRHAAALAERNAELQLTQRQLGVAHRREALDAERHRIARELHDSVTQRVLSAGMQIELCRAEVGDPGVDPAVVVERLGTAKDLTRRAVEQLRTAIYALNHDDGPERASLPELLEQLTTVHQPEELAVTVRVEGSPRELGVDVEHALLRIAGEALFNTAVHAGASRAVVRLSYRAGEVAVSVADDGHGRPEVLRRALAVAEAGDVDGQHRGLANMATRARELGGTFEIRTARLGGIRIGARVPLPTGAGS
ncbi:two-component system sensor histidine kinase MnoS [Rhodococcus aerolatus]